jgi:hypothetical protein
MNIPIARTLVAVVAAAGFALPAFADDHDWRDRERERARHERYEHRHERPYVTYAPGYVYAPPPVYYAPPPPPPLVVPSFNVVIPLRLH